MLEGSSSEIASLFSSAETRSRDKATAPIWSSPRAKCTGLQAQPVDPGAVGAAQVFDVGPVSSSRSRAWRLETLGSCRQTSHSASQPIVAEPGSSTYVRRGRRPHRRAGESW